MFRVTRYCIQTFAKRGSGLAPAEAKEFMREGEARAAGKAAARRMAGVAIYSVVGEPVFNLWREPKLLDTIGEVPAHIS